MLKKASIIRYVIGFLLIIVSYSTVNGARTNYDMTVERTIEISQGFFVPLIIGFILIWPVFRKKSNNTLLNILRLIVGLTILGMNLFSMFNLLDWAFYEFSGTSMTLKDFYFYNADFAAWVFLLSAKIIFGCLLVAPFFKISRTSLTDMIEDPNSISSDFKSIVTDLKTDLKIDSKTDLKKEPIAESIWHILTDPKTDLKDDFKKILSNVDNQKKSISNQFSQVLSKISEDKKVTIPLNPSNDDTDKIELLIKYKKLLDEDIITQEEFEQQKKKLLDLKNS